MPSHPFTWIRDSSRRLVFWLLTVLAVLTMAALQILGGPLMTSQSPAGIVSFELAGSSRNAQAILEAWDDQSRVYAGLNLGLDFLFIGAYVGAIGLGCVLVAARLGGGRRRLGTAGVCLAWATVAAGLLDVIENCALVSLLLGSQAAFLPRLAQGCAIPKFLLVLTGLAYIAGGGVARRSFSPSGQSDGAA